MSLWWGWDFTLLTTEGYCSDSRGRNISCDEQKKELGGTRTYFKVEAHHHLIVVLSLVCVALPVNIYYSS